MKYQEGSDRMIRVLHAIETASTGGAERVLVDVARSLSPDFHSIGMTLVEGWTSRELRRHAIDTHVLPLQRAFDWRWPARFARFLRSHAIDVVHCHEFTTTCYAALGSMLAGVPLVSTMHGKNYWPERAYRRRALHWAAGRSHAFVAVSEDLQRFAAQVLSLPAKQVQVVPNGVDLAAFVPNAEASARIRSSLGISPDDVVIVAVGALEPVKGHAALIEAMAQVCQRAPAAKLWIVGEGYLRSELEALVERHGLRESIAFLGWRTDIHHVIAAADFSVLASKSEGMPLAVMESMACARPVVATRVGGLPELIEHEVSGLLVQPDDVGQLAAALHILVAQPQRRRELGEAAYQRASARFSLAAMTASYQEIYRTAVTKRAN
jgi:glycosyltransferase involved in cell wall biosynthesis